MGGGGGEGKVEREKNHKTNTGTIVFLQLHVLHKFNIDGSLCMAKR